MKVELNKYEIEICSFIGRLRNKSCRDSNVKNLIKGKGDNIEYDIHGFMGEYAFAKYYNLFPDTTIIPRSGSYDILTRLGNRCDIKSTKRKDGNLIAHTKINPDVDIYILAYIGDNYVEFIGWIPKNEFIRESNLKDLGYGLSYFLHKSKLKPLPNSL